MFPKPSYSMLLLRRGSQRNSQQFFNARARGGPLFCSLRENLNPDFPIERTLRSFGSCRIKGTDESTLDKDSLCRGSQRNSQQFFNARARAGLFVGFTLQAKLVSSKHLIQVHLKISSRTLENLASHLVTKDTLEAQAVNHRSR